MDAQEVYTILLFVQCRLSIAYFVFPLLQPTQNQLFKKRASTTNIYQLLCPLKDAKFTKV
jgi:hypothetical protein